MDTVSTARHDEIIWLRGTGKTLAEIGKSYGISRQRVAQIVGKTGYIPRHPCPTTKLVRQLTAFLRNIEVRGECWIWRGYVHPNGYGMFCNEYVHRWSYETYVGEIPDGLNVCHTCDTKRCANPAHLYTGTQTQNMHDRDTRGRHGKRNHPQEYYDQRAAEIRKDYDSGVTGPVLAVQYHTHISTVYNAIHRPDQNAREK